MKIFVLIFILFYNCSISDEDKYLYAKISPINKIIESDFELKKNLLIKPCEDLTDSTNITYRLLIAFPLVPFAVSKSSKPEKVWYYDMDFRPEIDIPKMIKESISTTNVFQKVEFSDNRLETKADYILNCKIKQRKIYERDTLYGLSFLPGRFIKDFPYFILFIIHSNYPTITTEFEFSLSQNQINNIIYTKNIFYKDLYFEMSLIESLPKKIRDTYYGHIQNELKKGIDDLILFLKDNQ